MPLTPGAGRPPFEVQKAGLAGSGWTTVSRGTEAQAREAFARLLRLYSVGRFRLLGPEGQVVAEAAASPLFGRE